MLSKQCKEIEMTLHLQSYFQCLMLFLSKRSWLVLNISTEQFIHYSGLLKEQGVAVGLPTCKEPSDIRP